MGGLRAQMTAAPALLHDKKAAVLIAKKQVHFLKSTTARDPGWTILHWYGSSGVVCWAVRLVLVLLLLLR